jgi:hypothetical protein
MVFPTTSSPVEFPYDTKLKDQEAGLVAAIAYGQKKGWELVSVIWIKQDEDGHHHFNIIYNP